MIGDAGNDQISLRAADDYADEGDGVPVGGADRDVASGGAGDDYLPGEAGADTLIGGADVA